MSFAFLLSRPSAKCREEEEEARPRESIRAEERGGANMDGRTDGLTGAEFLRKSPILQQDRAITRGVGVGATAIALSTKKSMQSRHSHEIFIPSVSAFAGSYQGISVHVQSSSSRLTKNRKCKCTSATEDLSKPAG